MFQNQFIPNVIGVPPWPAIAPLISGLDDRGDLKLTTLFPDRHADPLGELGCACALVSPATLLDAPALHVLPGAGFVVNETSPSERLLWDGALESIRRISVTPGAIALERYVQVLFAEQGLPVPELVEAEYEDSEEATLVSGVDSSPNDRAGYDVAAMWRACTGTPLVLGVWACRSDGPIRLLRHVLGEAARRGEAELDGSEATRHYYYRILSAESDSIRALHRLARKHAIAGANVEAIGFC